MLERHDEIDLAPEVRTQLLAMSASTMDRVLKPYRTFNLRRPYTTRKSPGALKAQIPIRTFGERGEVKPGSLQVDLLAHCYEVTTSASVTLPIDATRVSPDGGGCALRPHALHRAYSYGLIR